MKLGASYQALLAAVVWLLSKAVFTLNVNYIQQNYNSIYHTPFNFIFNYGSVHICENSNKLGRVTSQSEVENKMAPHRTSIGHSLAYFFLYEFLVVHGVKLMLHHLFTP